MFWTDVTQAQERLQGTFVCYDKKPFFIERVDHRDDKGGPCAVGVPSSSNGKVKVLSLSDEKWNDFRDLPVLGWFNYIPFGSDIIQPVLIERKAVNSRSHGINGNNTRLYILERDGVKQYPRSFDLMPYFSNEGYQETSVDERGYPNLSTILAALDDTPGGVAFSRKFCVVVTAEGMKWLVRRDKKIGFFTGTDSLNLFPKMGFYKEELQACSSFDINNIKEF